MNQRKYIITAILLVGVSVAIYLGFEEFPQGKDSENISTNIDHDKPSDSLTRTELDGKKLFMGKCASCHTIFKDMTGPALFGATERGPWKDSIKFYKYIRDPESFGKNKYIDSLRQMYGSRHMGFPDLSGYEIKSILEYINKQDPSSIKTVVD